MKNLLFLAGLLFGMMFVACSSDDDDASSSSGNGGGLVGVWKYRGTSIVSSDAQKVFMIFADDGGYVTIDADNKEIGFGLWSRSGNMLTVTTFERSDVYDDSKSIVPIVDKGEYRIEDNLLYVTTGITLAASRVSEEAIEPYVTIKKLDDYTVNLSSLCPDKKHPHVIDLGEAGKWACCNVGASSPGEFGGYYAWGETEEKDYYDWSTYKHCDGSEKSCHNLGSDIAGTNYDVAHVKWGGSWKMPSKERFGTLFKNCDDYKAILSDNRFFCKPSEDDFVIKNHVFSFKVDTEKSYDIIPNLFQKNGEDYNIFYGPDYFDWYLNENQDFKSIFGILFMAKNGKYIFLPAAGKRWHDSTDNVGSYGHYWSSTQYPSYSDSAYYLHFYSGSVDWYYYGRYYGRSVRPVTE